MGVIETKIFRNGNSLAVRLPKDMAFAPDTLVKVERRGDTITIRPARDPAEEKRRLLALLAELDAIGVPGSIEKREPIDFRD